MRINKWLLRSALALCLSLLAISTALASDSADSDYPKKIVDNAGREITIHSPVQRIIANNGDAVEAIIMLGEGDKIVAVSDTVKQKSSYYFPMLKKVPSVGTFNKLDYEMIGAIAKGGNDTIAPDIIFIGYSYPGKAYGIEAHAKALAPFENITCIGLDFFYPENMTNDMEKLGVILNKEAEAREYINWYNEKASDIKDAVKDTLMPMTYVEWTSKGDDLSGMGPTSGAGQMVKAVNAYNIFSGLTDAYPKINWEYIISKKPDIIIKRQSTASDAKALGWEAPPSAEAIKLESVVQEIMGRSAANTVPAVKNGKVYVFNWDFMSGPDQIVGLTYLAKVIHPEAKLDPESVYREYLEKIGLEYPEGRIFVYPAPETK
ncbi:MAG TPA: ABC transporter substrate-binding protein [Methanothrix sp.]|nr:ABC transporter substrate-binding protein [Methanothrix sp.]